MYSCSYSTSLFMLLWNISCLFKVVHLLHRECVLPGNTRQRSLHSHSRTDASPNHPLLACSGACYLSNPWGDKYAICICRSLRHSSTQGILYDIIQLACKGTNIEQVPPPPHQCSPTNTRVEIPNAPQLKCSLINNSYVLWVWTLVTLHQLTWAQYMTSNLIIYVFI